jgi:hypothetical protein
MKDALRRDKSIRPQKPEVMLPRLTVQFENVMLDDDSGETLLHCFNVTARPLLCCESSFVWQGSALTRRRLHPTTSALPETRAFKANWQQAKSSPTAAPTPSCTLWSLAPCLTRPLAPQPPHPTTILAALAILRPCFPPITCCCFGLAAWARDTKLASPTFLLV